MNGNNTSSTHPQLPPNTEEQRFLWLRLLRSRRVGPTTFFRLLREHGNAAAALDALPDVARKAGVTDYTPCPPASIVQELKAAKHIGAQLLFYGDDLYPKSLCDLRDAPPMLWALGDLSLLSRPQIALVGARNASSLGLRMTTQLAAGLGEKGQVITSGMARGIDTAAHDAALKTGTVAVFGGGVDVIYPTENTNLAHKLREQGLILSEQPVGMHPRAHHFPARNRIISGLARATVVIEAATKSGSLITAQTALDQGRDVLAVPGHPFDARAAGCNMLIRDGATLVRSADDVMQALRPIAPIQQELALPEPTPFRAKRTLRQTAKLHQRILDRLNPAPLSEDQLIRDLHAATHSITPAVVDLEMHGQIDRDAGGLLSRNC